MTINTYPQYINQIFHWWLMKWYYNDITSLKVALWHLYQAILWRKQYITEFVNSGTHYRPIEDPFQDPILDLKIHRRLYWQEINEILRIIPRESLVRIPKTETINTKSEKFIFLTLTWRCTFKIVSMLHKQRTTQKIIIMKTKWR